MNILYITNIKTHTYNDIILEVRHYYFGMTNCVKATKFKKIVKLYTFAANYPGYC